MTWQAFSHSKRHYDSNEFALSGHVFWSSTAPVGSLARLGLAQAYAIAGDTTKSRAAYQEFLML